MKNELYNKLNNNSSIKLIISKSKTASTASSNKDEPQNQKENNWENLLLTFFTTINSIDNQIENIRSNLKYLKNFSSENLFDYLDNTSKKCLTLNDFKIFLQSNKIPFVDKNLRKFIHNFDKDNDFSINFKEFLGIISPKKEEIKKEQKESNIQKKGEVNLIDDEIKKIFGELIIGELNFVEKFYELTQNIRNCKEFTTYEAFTKIVGVEKYINSQNLGNFLKNKGLKITDKELTQLMFRMDSDNDGLISYDEFKGFFMPLNEIDDFKYKDYKEKNSYLKFYNEDKYIINDKIDKNEKKDKLEFKYGKNEKDLKIDLQLKINSIKINNNKNINLNNKDIKDNKNEINFKQKDNYNLKFGPKNIEIKGTKLLNKNEDIQNVSNLFNDKQLIYDKSIIIDNQINQIKENDNNKDIIFNKKIIKRNSKNLQINLVANKSKDDSLKKRSNNNLLYETQSILNYTTYVRKEKGNDYKNEINNNKTNNNNYNYKIDINNNYNTNINNNKNYIIKTPIKIKENENLKLINDNNFNKGEKFLDTFLNFDYSRISNKDKNNGQYYFKQNQKNKILDYLENNKIEENKNNSNYFKNSFINYEKEKPELIKNNSMHNSEYIYDKKASNNIESKTNKNNSQNLNLQDNKSEAKKVNIKKEKNEYKYFFEEEENNIHNKNNINSKYNNSSVSINTYKADNDYGKYISHNYEYYKKLINDQKKFDLNNPLKNNYMNINFKQNKTSIEQHYLDSLENSPTLDPTEFSKINNKNKFQYKNKLTRNIKSQNNESINNSYKTKEILNNSMINFNFNEKKSKLNKTILDKEENDNQNRSCILFNNNDKNYLSNEENKYNEGKINYKNFNKINENKYKYRNNYCSIRCPKCHCIKENIKEIKEEENEYYNFLKKNINLINKNKHSLLPENIFKKTNNLNLELNYNDSSKTNNNSFYLESSQIHNNLIINKINNNNHYNNNINHKNNELNDKNNKYSSFYNLLLGFIKQDNSIENIRQSLSLREDANLTDLFDLFDHSSNQLISSMDFLETLKVLGLIVEKDEIKFLFRRFNKNLNEYFEFEEFCEIILPKKYSSAKIMNEKQVNRNFYEISEETKKIICSLFKNIIEAEKSNENYRKSIGESGEYSGFDLFNKIKKNYSIGIYKEDIAKFMSKNNYMLSNFEIEFLMERFDKNKDGMIDYKEFLNEISSIDEL